jgi:hypothetical protein
MAQTTHESAEQLKAQARGAANELGTEAKKVGETLGNEVSDLAQAARTRLEAEAATQKDVLADRLKGVAERVHQSAESFRKDEAWIADWVDEGARRLHGASEDIRNRDVRSIIDWFTHLSRRQPAVVMGASVAAGFALSRLARASADEGVSSVERYMSNDRQGGRQRAEQWQWSDRPETPRTGMPQGHKYDEALEGRYGEGKQEGPGTKPARPGVGSGTGTGSSTGTEADKHLGGPR